MLSFMPDDKLNWVSDFQKKNEGGGMMGCGI